MAQERDQPTTIKNTSVTVHVPLVFRRRGGRKVLLAPDGETRTTTTQQFSPKVTPIVRALARAFRWRRLIESGTIATVHDIATTEGINPSYVSRILRLTLLAPEVVEGLMAAPKGHVCISLDRLMKPFPVEWHLHRATAAQDDAGQGPKTDVVVGTIDVADAHTSGRDAQHSGTPKTLQRADLSRGALGCPWKPDCLLNRSLDGVV